MYVSICVCHINSIQICVKVRPVSKKTKYGYLQVGVETYGGGIWHSWFDRDLSLAGRVVFTNKNGGFTPKLIKIDRPLLRIPTLAIHCKVHIQCDIPLSDPCLLSGQNR